MPRFVSVIALLALVPSGCGDAAVDTTTTTAATTTTTTAATTTETAAAITTTVDPNLVLEAELMAGIEAMAVALERVHLDEVAAGDECIHDHRQLVSGRHLQQSRVIAYPQHDIIAQRSDLPEIPLNDLKLGYRHACPLTHCRSAALRRDYLVRIALVSRLLRPHLQRAGQKAIELIGECLPVSLAE